MPRKGFKTSPKDVLFAVKPGNKIVSAAAAEGATTITDKFH